MFSKIWNAALDLLYGDRCPACDALLERGDDVFCANCARSLEPNDSACPRCARPLPASRHPPPCLDCLQRAPRFSGARAPFVYGGALAEAIKRLKWDHQPELATALGVLLDDAVTRAPPFSTVELIVPVPLHPRRLRKREFNQAALLAASLRASAAIDGAPLGRAGLDVRVLERIRDTAPQTGLDRLERRRNVLGAFAVRDHARVRDKRVLLVDDVMTTGATADACAWALTRAGAAEVLVLTLGRAVP